MVSAMPSPFDPAFSSPEAIGSNHGRKILQSSAPPCPPPGVLIAYNYRLYCITCTVDQELITGDDFPWCRAVDCSTKYGPFRPIWNTIKNLCEAPLPPSPYSTSCLPGFICTSPPPPSPPSPSLPPSPWLQPQIPPSVPFSAPSDPSPFPLPTSPLPPTGASFQPPLPGSPFSPASPTYPLQPPPAQASAPPPPPQPADCGPHGTPAAPDKAS
ncbi:unnamed protein product [Closterium sp. Naga37s-1]|nr:unnamed protein product [Closterium sp. Naga37s-1]